MSKIEFPYRTICFLEGIVKPTSPGGPLQVNAGGTEALKVDSNGIVTKPAQPAFLVTGSDTNIVVYPSLQTCTLNTEVFDVGGNFASNTFTAPVTGKYLLNLKVEINQMDSAAIQYNFQIITSNRSYSTGFDANNILSADSDNTTGFGFSVLADMDANDTAYCAVEQISGAQQADISTCFSGYLAF